MDLSVNSSKIISDYILNQIRLSKEPWVEVFMGPMRRIGDWGNPTPDYVYEDITTERSMALFFSEPGHKLNEYYQLSDAAVKILSRHDYCTIIVPRTADNSFVATNIEAKLYNDGLGSLPIAIVEYTPDLLASDINTAINTARSISLSQKVSIPKSKTERKSYWCWWRDASCSEVFQLLQLSDNYSDEDGDIYTDYIYPHFYEMMINGETKQWNGKPRNKKYSQASFKSEKQNYKIPLVQLGLWNAENCQLTNKGKRLLSFGIINGSESDAFLMALSKIILVDGKHLDLIKDVVDFQTHNKDIIPETSEEFFALLDMYLTDHNSIGTRKPTAVKSGAKKAYVRDEPKLWNKLGVVYTQSGGRYYKPFIGIEFNWDRINEILLLKW